MAKKTTQKDEGGGLAVAEPPPGRCRGLNRAVHGPERPLGAVAPIDKLRDAMGLSGEVAEPRVIEEAARTLWEARGRGVLAIDEDD